jgi:hypothetical protein
MLLSYSGDPVANGKIRTFVAAARGLADVARQAEEITTTACQRMGADLGIAPGRMVPAQPGPAAAATAACGAVAEEIGVIVGNLAVPVEISPPECEPDRLRQGRCEARCATTSDPDCAATCSAHAAVYARCKSARIVMEAQGAAERAVALQGTLQRNLPWRLHAQLALGRRLGPSVQQLGRASAELPRALADAGPVGLACLAASGAAVVGAAQQLEASLRASESVTQRLAIREQGPAASSPGPSLPAPVEKLPTLPPPPPAVPPVAPPVLPPGEEPPPTSPSTTPPAETGTPDARGDGLETDRRVT